ncbi:hypothetical protein ARAM_007284 [Aspergillus rambellii]|uniref:non-specific serine/threonine protein kinase n=1 Tax=Aspergillus rambellii TaxID=308745 RepID=A0A0F8WRA5_9EURO|nr:hypothetical protein ARAM_007284 [Aspergillus rambellii]
MAASHLPMQLSISTSTTKTQLDAAAQTPLAGAQGLTPPVTPTIEDGNSLETATPLPSSTGSSAILSPVEPDPTDACLGAQTVAVSSPPQFAQELEYQLDPRGRPVEFGRGAWSVVHKALSSTPADESHSPTTPPSSSAPVGRVVAVKSPARRDAHAVLHAEALALTRASLVPGSEHHLVPFHGYIADSHSIVMSAVPLSLSSYIEDKARIAQQNKSTKTMFDPVQGMAQWHDLAKKLVTGLSWLHSGPQLVHGDIKPHNLLLQPRPSVGDDPDSAEFPYEPLFADFSSSHPITPPASEKATATSLTALTPPFAAPELLCVSSLSSPDVAPTPASDVFSLAVTLLAAATGDLLLYPGTSSMQRLAMAREGHRVIEFTRSGPNGSRVPRNGTVEKILKPATSKDPIERILPGEWVQLAQTVA